MAGLELVCRQIQICEGQLSHRFEVTYGEALSDLHLMTGPQIRNQLCICPMFRAWIVSEAQKESSVLKELRQAEEERELANPHMKGGKGGAGGEA